MTPSKIFLPKTFLPILALCAAFVSCGPNIQNKEAVKQGIMDYFQKKSPGMGLDINLMAIDVVSVSFKNSEATATVAFRPKQSVTNDSAMQMTYVLEQKGKKWEVKGRPSANSDTHAPGGAAPQSKLPPGHPPAGEPAPKAPGTMPPGHPPVDPSMQKN